MSRFGYPKSARLRKRAEFDRVFKGGRGRGDARMVVHAVTNGTPGTRLGIVIPKGVKSALRRNRLKRLLREAFRLRLAELPEGLDLVVIPRPDPRATRAGFEESLKRLTSRQERPR